MVAAHGEGTGVSVTLGGSPPPGTLRQEVATMASIGEERVRVSFNPKGDFKVDEIKRAAAALIDVCEELKEKDPRLAALAQTAFEEGAMWAVKAATA